MNTNTVASGIAELEKEALFDDKSLAIWTELKFSLAGYHEEP